MCARLKHNPVSDDGVFHMSLRDMCNVYTRLVWVQVRPQCGAHPWKHQSAKGSWAVNPKQSIHAAGGCPNVLSWWTNPQYTVHVKRAACLHVSLEQQASHMVNDFRGYLTIGFSVFCLGDSSDGAEEAQGTDENFCVLSPSLHTEVASSAYQSAQAVSAHIEITKPGFYKVVYLFHTFMVCSMTGLI